MKIYLINFIFLLSLCLPAKVFGIVMTDSSNDKVLTQTGSFSVSVSSWISVNLSQAADGTGSMFSSDNNCALSASVFGITGTAASPLPCLLSLSGCSYFVSVLGEQKVNFSVNYQDSYGNAPSPGYPNVTYCKQGTNTSQTIPLSLVSGTGCSGLYSAAITLPAGVYSYKYAAKNNNYPSEYDLPQSSFVVTGKPTPPSNSGLNDTAVTSNGKIVLKWAAADPDGGALTYQLYFGKTPTSMELVYQGSSNSFERDTLDYKQTYYWYVIATNQFGVSTPSQTYSFSTIGEIKKAYNYPNPFNPARNESTNIVFEMQEDGLAEVKIFSEYGNLCWQRTFYDLPKGINQASYDGRDESGNMMYNGTYPCIIKKKYPNGEQTDHCRLLIIK